MAPQLQAASSQEGAQPATSANAGSNPIVQSASATPSTAADSPSNAPNVAASTSTGSTRPSMSAQSSSSNNNNNGHSAGEVAGAAVGAAIGGALIAFLVAWLIFRKRRNTRRAPSYGHSQSYDTKDEAIVTEKSLSSKSNPVYSWQAYLPQSADDKTVQNAVKTLFDQVDQHVENFYQMPAEHVGHFDQQALAQINSGQLPGSLVELLQDQRLAITVIKHCIVALLIERITPSSKSGYSLLPAYLSSVVPKKKSEAPASGEQDVTPQAYSQWKLLNAYLQPQPDKDPSFVQGRNSSSVQLSELLEAALAPWQVAAEDRNAFKQHEQSMIAFASSVGVLILSQPSSFRFRWNATADGTRNASSRSLITYPGLWKSTDETGIPLTKPQLLLSPVVVRI